MRLEFWNGCLQHAADLLDDAWGHFPASETTEGVNTEQQQERRFRAQVRAGLAQARQAALDESGGAASGIPREHEQGRHESRAWRINARTNAAKQAEPAESAAALGLAGTDMTEPVTYGAGPVDGVTAAHESPGSPARTRVRVHICM